MIFGRIVVPIPIPKCKLDKKGKIIFPEQPTVKTIKLSKVLACKVFVDYNNVTGIYFVVKENGKIVYKKINSSEGVTGSLCFDKTLSGNIEISAGGWCTWSNKPSYIRYSIIDEFYVTNIDYGVDVVLRGTKNEWACIVIDGKIEKNVLMTGKTQYIPIKLNSGKHKVCVYLGYNSTR